MQKASVRGTKQREQCNQSIMFLMIEATEAKKRGPIGANIIGNLRYNRVSCKGSAIQESRSYHKIFKKDEVLGIYYFSSDRY